MIGRSLCRFALAGLVLPGWLVILSAASGAQPLPDATQVETFVVSAQPPGLDGCVAGLLKAA